MYYKSCPNRVEGVEMQKKVIAALMSATILTAPLSAQAVGLGSDPFPPSGTVWVYHASPEVSDSPASSSAATGRIVQGALGVAGAILFTVAGLQLIGIRSISGDSIAEDSYHGIGVMSLGLAALSLGVTAAAASDAAHDR